MLEQTKTAIAAGLLTGSSCREVAEQTGAGLGTVGRVSANLSAQIMAEKQKRIGDLLVSLVEKIAESSHAVAGLLNDPAYLRQHNPHDIAVLFGTLMDKGFVILGAIERANLRRPPEGGDGGAAGGVVEANQPESHVRADASPDPDPGTGVGRSDA